MHACLRGVQNQEAVSREHWGSSSSRPANRAEATRRLVFTQLRAPLDVQEPGVRWSDRREKGILDIPKKAPRPWRDRAIAREITLITCPYGNGLYTDSCAIHKCDL